MVVGKTDIFMITFFSISKVHTKKLKKCIFCEKIRFLAYHLPACFLKNLEIHWFWVRVLLGISKSRLFWQVSKFKNAFILSYRSWIHRVPPMDTKNRRYKNSTSSPVEVVKKHAKSDVSFEGLDFGPLFGGFMLPKAKFCMLKMRIWNHFDDQKWKNEIFFMHMHQSVHFFGYFLLKISRIINTYLFFAKFT